MTVGGALSLRVGEGRLRCDGAGQAKGVKERTVHVRKECKELCA